MGRPKSDRLLEAHKYDAKDGKNVILYNEPHKKSDPPSPRFLKWWKDLVDEVTDKYSPEGIYFDYGIKTVVPDKMRREMIASFYNKNVEKGKISDAVLIHKYKDIMKTGMLDTERSRLGKISKEGFLNDKSIGKSCWYNKKWYFENDGMATDKELISALVDLASKNGALMLSIAPDKDGVIPEEQKKIMLRDRYDIT